MLQCPTSACRLKYKPRSIKAGACIRRALQHTCHVITVANTECQRERETEIERGRERESEGERERWGKKERTHKHTSANYTHAHAHTIAILVYKFAKMDISQWHMVQISEQP